MGVDAKAIERAFERAPALVDRLAGEAPFASVDGVIARARGILAGMSDRDRVRVLDAHPRIGAPAATLSAESAREQGGEDEPGLLDELAILNDAYERTHGFRFVAFVAGRRRSQVLPVLRERLARPREREMATGIDEFLAIARDRLSA